MKPDSTVFTPSSIVLGRVPVKGDVDVRLTAFHSAASALDDERIQLVAVKYSDSVYYIAAPSADFASVGSPSATTLAQALPGWPGHKGAGYYWANLRDGLVAVVSVSEDGDVEVFTGLRDDAVRFASDGRQQWTPTETAQWTGVTREAQRDLRAIGRWITGAACAISVCLLIGSSVAMAISVQQNKRTESARDVYMASAGQAIATVRTSEADHRVWQRFVSFARSVVERQGRAMKYSDDGKNVTYEVMLPVWTTDFRPFDGAVRKEMGKLYLTLSKGDLK
ncbi:hypothetical protein ACUXQ2_005692 [Cupriavidus metallidurans]|uniref:hypothetical protein n=1 Tax=Cupriavidus metallidurans TaxID=119219 RepID=UPI00056B4096|nr:hypothetical protein [Cupriavidus metallidurans]